MKFLSSLFFCLALFLFAPSANAQVELAPTPPQFKIEIQGYVMTDVPVSKITIRAYDIDGKFDKTYNGNPLIKGIRLKTRTSDDTRLEAFKNGVLELKSNLAKRHKIYVVSNEIVVDPENPRKGVLPVVRINRWMSIVPPLIAVLLAVWLKNVLISLFTAIWVGATILFQGNLWKAFLETIDTFLVGEMVAVSSSGEHSHMQIALFTLFLGAMVGVMSQSGGTMALVNKMKSVTQTREQGQVMTWFLGLIVFFDDYANTLLVGSTMRPVTDRLKISREKLAFLVDSTAAPIAGLAIISTWVGVEVNYIEDAYQSLGITGDAYTTFLYTIPFRFYPLHLLVFVLLIAYTGHDFGSMLKAEERALLADDPETSSEKETTVDKDEEKDEEKKEEEPSETEKLPGSDAKHQLARNAIMPLCLLVIAIAVGLWMTGKENLAEDKPQSVANILGAANSQHVLLVSSFIASIFAVAMATFSRSLSLRESLEAWMDGAKNMFEAVVTLSLAWGIAILCHNDYLNTAGFIIEISDGLFSAVWMPTLAFILAGLVAFATGSSWATMGLLMPVLIPVVFHMILNQEQGAVVNGHHPILLGTIGAILAGAIFGDHCSPISDTTILSSAASGCDHLDHVRTQIPYAFTVAGVSLVFGYIPVGFGLSPVITLPLGVGVLLVIVLFWGRPGVVAVVEEKTEENPKEDEL
ncbi:Na+/H+ antiporter [hydrothermal vent metagenome]|uniref:Na+/H+ antiporter n=1 Tax=hydrothermal vent metagenome TaxID=652676 RepID=A0A3B1DEL6_9ZZZZ